VFRDPLFSQTRPRARTLHGIRSRQLAPLRVRDRLDRWTVSCCAHARGRLRAMSFGVESVAPSTLKKVGRRPIPGPHQRECCAAAASWARDGGVLRHRIRRRHESIGATIDYAIDLGSTWRSSRF
jgi:hypothetical protein